MNAQQVDVLAVLDREVNRLLCAWHDFAPGDTGPEPPTLQAAREARAAVAELIDERNRLANIVDSHEAQILRMTAEAADLIREHERAKAALADAVDWIGTMRCDDTETHPRLRVLRAALARMEPQS